MKYSAFNLDQFFVLWKFLSCMAQLEFAALYLRYEKKDFNVHLLAH